MNKEAFKIVCYLIYKQLITYDEARILIEALNEKVKDVENTCILVPQPCHTYPFDVEPQYRPNTVYCENSSSTGSCDNFPYPGTTVSQNDFDVTGTRFTNGGSKPETK